MKFCGCDISHPPRPNRGFLIPTDFHHPQKQAKWTTFYLIPILELLEFIEKVAMSADCKLKLSMVHCT